ncbi:MAG: DUF2007 domain-containing protein [Anaerolineae bacterium]
MKRQEALEIVYRAAGEAEAHLIRGRLESEGVPTLLRTGTGGAYGVPGGSLGGVDVLVPRSDVERARQILSQRPPDEER